MSTIGRSGTGECRLELSRRDIAVTAIGQFGIGLLSAFVVAERIDVFTRKVETEEVWHWFNDGDEEYDLSRAQTDNHAVGTRVGVRIGRDRIDEEQLLETVKKYADFISFNIPLNGNGPVNVVDAPRHRGRAAFINEGDYARASNAFLNERYKDVPLHVIPVNTVSPRADGAPHDP